MDEHPRVRVLSLEEVEAIENRWKYHWTRPTGLELECLFKTAGFAIGELEHILRQGLREKGES